MKKLFAMILALAMVLSLATTAFAATTNLEVVKSSTDNTPGARDYEAYQLMTATVSQNSDGTENFAYTVSEKYASVLISVLGLADTASNQDILDAINAKNTAELMRHFADELFNAIQAAGLTADVAAGEETWDGSKKAVDQGYYLIADVTNLEGTKYANSLVMIDTAGDSDVTVTNKVDIPESNKKVDDENDSLTGTPEQNPEAEDTIRWEDTADHDIGDSVPYSITIDLPNNVTEYSYYAIKLGDSVKAGLTYLPDTFKILVNGSEKTIAEAGEGVTTDFVYTIVTTTDAGKQTSQVLTVYPNHGYTKVEKDALGNNVTVAPSAANGGDFLGLFPEGTEHSTINNARIVFTYECRLNEYAVIGNPGNPNYYEFEFSNDPYSDQMGKLPKDVCIVFTYKTTFNKVDGKGNALAGADFELYKFIAKVRKDDMTKEAAEEAGYILHSAANAWGVYEQVTRKTTNAVANDPSTDEDETVEATVFSFTGLDDGYYKLEETKTPDGYNGISPIEFLIRAGHVTDIDEFKQSGILTSLTAGSVVSGEIELTTDVASGTASANVVNKSGTELPETGGMGTTLFYVVGGLMVAAAAILLVTKKRMSVEA